MKVRTHKHLILVSNSVFMTLVNFLIFRRRVRVSALEHCKKIKFTIYVDEILIIYEKKEPMLCLNDFVTRRK